MYLLIFSYFHAVTSNQVTTLQRGLQYSDHTLSRLQATIEVGVTEGIATTNKWWVIYDGHVTGTVWHRTEHLQEAAASVVNESEL